MLGTREGGRGGRTTLDPTLRVYTQQRLQLLLVMLLVLLLSPVAMGAAGAEPAAAAADWWRALAPDFVGDWDLETELLPPQQAPPPDGPRGAPLAEVGGCVVFEWEAGRHRHTI